MLRAVGKRSDCRYVDFFNFFQQHTTPEGKEQAESRERQGGNNKKAAMLREFENCRYFSYKKLGRHGEEILLNATHTKSLSFFNIANIIYDLF